MKLNIGSGGKPLAGYISIDAATGRKGVTTDLIADAKDIPLANECAEEIIAIHVQEHFYRWEIDQVGKEWYRLLQHGGKLTLEMPDLLKSMKNVIEYLGKDDIKCQQLGMWGLYGDPRHEDVLMTHQWGWTFKTIKPVLENFGFVDVVEKQTLFHGVGIGVRDFRVEARKP